MRILIAAAISVQLRFPQSVFWRHSITFGTLTLYPAYRSFPEVFANNPKNMYIPWSIDDAAERLEKMFSNPASYETGAVSDWQNGTIGRTLDIFEGKGEEWARNTNDYRKHVAKAKY